MVVRSPLRLTKLRRAKFGAIFAIYFDDQLKQTIRGGGERGKPLNSIDSRANVNLYLLIKLETKFSHTYVAAAATLWSRLRGTKRLSVKLDPVAAIRAIISEALKSLCKTGLAYSSLTNRRMQ